MLGREREREREWISAKGRFERGGTVVTGILTKLVRF